MRGKKLKRAAAMSAAVMMLGVFGTVSFAAERSDGVCQDVPAESITVIPEVSEFPENEELFAGYVDKLFYGENESVLYGNCGGEVLQGNDRIYYEKLKEQIKKAASGNLSTTKFKITVEDLGLEGKLFTAEELGVSALVQDGRVTAEALNALSAKVSFDLSKVVQYLLADCPYELYWYDKTSPTGGVGDAENFRISGTTEGLALIGGCEIVFPVAREYRPANSANIYTIDTEKTGSAVRASENAKAVALKNAGQTPYRQMAAFKEEICSLVSYNYDAVEDANTPYGDPWQLVYVFDGNPDTNVVCEGYSKAFQYLCDMADFPENVRCYTVTGSLIGGTGAGLHMWNVVSMEGKTYLVDVTNSDGESVGSGESSPLFLAGTTNKKKFDLKDEDGKDIRKEGYSFVIGAEGNYEGFEVGFVYDHTTEQLYKKEILELTSANYQPKKIDGYQNIFKDISYGAYYFNPVLWAASENITTGVGGTRRFEPDGLCTRANVVTFLWRAAGEPMAEGNSNTEFNDVKQSDYFYPAVQWAVSKGITTGYGNTGGFNPDGACTRANVVTFLWRANEQPLPEGNSDIEFKDVKESDYFYPAVQWAVSKGITTGYGNTKLFGADDSCTRANTVTFQYRAAGFPLE